MIRFFSGGMALLAAGAPFARTPALAQSSPSAPTAVVRPAGGIRAVHPTGSMQGGVATAVFAGGCFWGVDAVFKHVRGVLHVVSGYAGGDARTAEYEQVSTGTTGHAESVKVTYDTSRVSYDDLLRVFLTVAHDPTQLNRQGPDEGTQYRSVIFYTTDSQRRAAVAYIQRLTRAKAFPRPIVTQVTPLMAFYPAEPYHQDFAERHPDYPYIVIQDRPKIERLRTQLPEFYREATPLSGGASPPP